MDGDTLVNLGLVLVFVLIGGVFAGTEMALVSLREGQLKQMEAKGGRAAKAAGFARDPNKFLAAVQIGVTVAGFLSAAYGGSTLAPDFAPWFEDLGLSESAANSVALVVLTLGIAYLSLVFGELVPKRMAMQKSMGLATVTAPPLAKFAVAMRPVMWVLEKSTNGVVRLIGGDPHANSEEVTEEELRDIVSTHEALDDDERKILDDVFAARTSSLKEVMTPRGEVSFVRADMPLPEAADLVGRGNYSRYPVIGQDFDDVTGFLHVRDLLGVTATDARLVRDVQRQILMLPNTNRVLPTVALMREEGIHMTIVVDEYGGSDGIVTLEDLVEEIVGDIRDEYDDEEAPGGVLVDGKRTVSGGLTIEDFFDETGIELPDGDYETVAGYLINELGRIPTEGDQVAVAGATITVEEMVKRRVAHVRVEAVVEEPGDGADGELPDSV